MNFTSYHFVIFFFITLLLGHLLKNKAQRVFLLLASYYFYGVFEPWYLILILASTLWDYVASLAIAAAYRNHRASLHAKAWLASSVVFNIGLLAYFKYTNFGIDTLNDLHPAGGTVFSWPLQNILLPVGISFYSFQSLSYTIDVYRKQLEARRDFIDFALYVTFFPQLVAGPIVRGTTFFEQLDNRLTVTKDDIITGMTRIVMGFFRKLVLSDNLAPVVDKVFSNPGAYSTPDIWIASVGFGFQIYLDFAGYTDIARGVARLFGFEFDVNFNNPMAAKDITDHWKRWHISLTTWIRDYVYIPLGGSRISVSRTYLNMFIIWILTGLWHGPAWHFVVWGFWQAVMISVHKVYSGTSVSSFFRNHQTYSGPYTLLSRIITMFFLTFGFIFFRTPDMNSASIMIQKLFLPGDTASVYSSYAVLIVLYWFLDIFFDRYPLSWFRKEENRGKLTALMTALIFAIIVFSSPESGNFLYFQF